MSQEGEIVARLKLDGSDFKAGIEEAKAEAESLKTTDPKITVKADTATAIAGLEVVKARLEAFKAEHPTVKVGADVTGAVAKLQAVAAAEAALTRATDQQTRARMAADSASRAAVIAQQRLDDVMTKRGRTDLQVSQAEATLANATERADYTVQQVTKSAEQLQSARERLTSATRDAETAESDFDRALKSAANSTGNAGNAAKGAAPLMAILVGSIAAVSPGIVAVGAAAIGLSASLAGMGAVGALAIKGITAEMAAGTPLGNAYSDMLGTLTGDLSQLESAAAQGVFQGISAGISTLDANMGPLTGTVALLSNELGGMLSTSVTLAVDMVGRLGPVFMGADTAFQGFLQGIDSFTLSNGFTAFVDYTVARLPDVMHLIDSTLGAVGGIFTALAPAGQSTLFMLSSLMDLIRALSPAFSALMPVVEGLSGLIGGVALGLSAVLNVLGPFGPALVLTTAAFVGLGFAQKAIAGSALAAADAEGIAAVATRGLGAAVDFAMGPIGLLAIGAGFLVSALLTMPGSTQAAAASVTDLSTALQQDNGVIGQNTKALIAQTNGTNGANEAAKQLGISSRTLLQAQTGNAAAQKQVNAAVDAGAKVIENTTGFATRYGNALSSTQKAAATVSAAVSNQNTALKQAVAAYNTYATAIGGTTVASGQALIAQQHLAGQYGMDLPTYAAASAALLKNQTAAQAAGNAFATMAGLVDLATRAEYGVETTADNAVVAIGAMASAFTKSTTAAHGSTVSLDQNTAAGAQNRLTVTSAMEAISKHAQAMRTDGKSADEAKAYTDRMTASLIDNAVKAGANRSAVASLIGEILHIPKSAVLRITTNAAQAEQAILNVRNQMAAIDGLTSTVYVSTIASGVTPARAAQINRNALGYADGGTIGHAAEGITAGYSGTVSGPGTSAFDLAGLYRLANGEEVTSNMRGQADAFRGVLKAINTQKVKTPQQLGQMLGGGQPQVTNNTRNLQPIVNINYPVTQDPVTAAREAAQYIQAYSAI